MNILEIVRQRFGSIVSNVMIEDDQGNIVTQGQLEQRKIQSLEDSIVKAKELRQQTIDHFNEMDQELELKIQACDIILVKGENKDIAFNKQMLIEKRHQLLEKFIVEVTDIKKTIRENKDELKKGQLIDDLQKFNHKLAKKATHFAKAMALTEEQQLDVLCKASEKKQAKVKKVMDEWKQGSLKTSAGEPVADQKQAIAIALSEAGLSKKKKGKKKDNLKKAYDVFVYGTLKDADIRKEALGKEVPIKKVKVKGNVVDLKDDYKNFSPEGAQNIEGDVMQLSKKDIKRLDNWEDKYQRKKVHTEDGKKVYVYELKKAMGTGNTPGKETPEGKNGKATTIQAAAKSSSIIAGKVNKAEGDDLNKAEDYEGDYVGIVAQDKNNKVLLQKRLDNGEWMLPGGHIEKNELPIEAAKREFKEETNLEIPSECFCLVGEKTTDSGRRIFLFSVWNSSRENAGQLANLEGDEYSDCRFMSSEEWLKEDLFKNTKDFLKEIVLPSMVPLVKAELEQELEKAITSDGVNAEVCDDVIEKARKVIHTAEQLKAHAQGTSDVQLRKVAKDKNQPNHLRDVAKKELGDRVKTDKKEKWGDILTQIENKAKKDKLSIKDLVGQLREDFESDEDNDKSKKVLEKQNV